MELVVSDIAKKCNLGTVLVLPAYMYMYMLARLTNQNRVLYDIAPYHCYDATFDTQVKLLCLVGGA